jgi:hypothetical protein
MTSKVQSFHQRRFEKQRIVLIEAGKRCSVCIFDLMENRAESDSAGWRFQRPCEWIQARAFELLVAGIFTPFTLLKLDAAASSSWRVERHGAAVHIYFDALQELRPRFSDAFARRFFARRAAIYASDPKELSLSLNCSLGS